MQGWSFPFSFQLSVSDCTLSLSCVLVAVLSTLSFPTLPLVYIGIVAACADMYGRATLWRMVTFAASGDDFIVQGDRVSKAKPLPTFFHNGQGSH